jgi:hypothetical protein
MSENCTYIGCNEKPTRYLKIGKRKLPYCEKHYNEVIDFLRKR